MKAIRVSLPKPDHRPGGGGYFVSHEKIYGWAFRADQGEEPLLDEVRDAGTVIDASPRYVTLEHPIDDLTRLPQVAALALQSTQGKVA